MKTIKIKTEKKSHIKKNALALALGTVVLSAGALVEAEANPFGFEEMQSGYQLSKLAADARCGTGECGDSKSSEKSSESACGEGKCGSSKSSEKSSESGCGDGKCGSMKKTKDAGCGTGKCGSSK